MTPRWRSLLAALLTAALVTALHPASTWATPRRSGPANRASVGAAAPTGIVPDDIADRYTSTRPPLGPVTVVDVGGESNDRKLLATTLQGSVNRTQARIYLRGIRAAQEDQRWLDHYTAAGLITIAETVHLDAALAEFGPELGGYVVASDAEPWTVNTATTVAGIDRGVVVTPATIALAQSAGLTEIEDHRGRWTDAATAYAATLAAHRNDLRLPTTALQDADLHNSRDLYVQQGVFVAFTRPAQADFDAVYDLLETLPNGHPIYGYVSDTGIEEVQAVARLSLDDRYLIPTDTADNLSFHLAVGGERRALPQRADTTVEPCTTDDVNVVLALSDGDNVTVAEAYDPRPENWGSPQRGTLPIGWGITPALSVLAPAMWDRYVSEATPADEIVDIMGLGYSYGSVMPHAAAHLAGGERLRSTLGIATHWSLDALLSDPEAKGWAAVADAATRADTTPAGILLNYERWDGPAWFHSDHGVPVLASQQSSYDDGPAQLATSLRALAETPASERPLVSFYAITVWSSTYDGLVQQIAPLADEVGIRFLTPADAFACLPAWEPPTTTTTSTTPTTVTSTTAATEGATATPPPAEPVDGGTSYVG